MLRFLPALAPLSGLLLSGLLAAPILDVDTSSDAAPAPAAPAAAADRAEPGDQPASESPPAVRPLVPPFVGIVAVDAANVRGGPSTNHFPLARLGRGSQVNVLKRTLGWYQIEPPEGVFCWIHRDFVTVDPDGHSGAVTGQNVNVRGDSILGHAPIKSDVVDQVRAGARVTVVGRDADFLRIKPTPGTRVYVHADLIAPEGGPARAETGGPAAEAAPRQPATLAVGVFRDAEQALRAERLKPPAEWDLDRLTTLYRSVLEEATAPRVRAVAESRLLYLQRLARLRATLEGVERGREQMLRALKTIDDRRTAEEAALAAKRSQTPDYTLTGILKTLELSDGRPRFKLVHPDDPKRILCVVEGDVAVLQPLVDRRVGISGQFRVTSRWPVKVLQVAQVEPLATGEDTRLALPPAPTE